MISVEAERNKRQEDLRTLQKARRTRIQKVEEELKGLDLKMDTIHQSTDKAFRDVEDHFAEILHPLERQRSDLKEKIRTNHEAAVNRVKDLQKILEQEIVDTKRSEAELEHLSHIQSHVKFLQKYPQNAHLK